MTKEATIYPRLPLQVPAHEALGTVRLTLGRGSTEDDLRRAASALAEGSRDPLLAAWLQPHGGFGAWHATCSWFKGKPLPRQGHVTDHYAGPHVLHCHNLEHEDAGMMLNREVL